MSRRVPRVSVVSVLLVLTTGLGPLHAQEPRRNMFEGLFGPPVRTPPSFSRPEATALPHLLPRPSEGDSSAAQPQPPSAAEPSEAANTAAIRSEERSRSLTLAPQPRPNVVQEAAIQKKQGTEPSQVRPNRRLSATPTSRRHGGNSRGWVAPRVKTDQPTPATGKPVGARDALAMSVAPRLPHRLTPRHARSE
jgi:hypothetical protein